MKIRKLKASEVECRISQTHANGAVGLLYKTARVDRAILDENFPNKWQNDFKVIDGKMYGGIGIYNDELKEWVWRWDCGTENNTEKEKSEASDCFKRAGFNWGIGIELYSAPFIWLAIKTKKNEKGKFEPENKFIKLDVSAIGYDENGNINELEVVDDKGNVLFSINPKKKPISPSKSTTQPPQPSKLAKVENKTEKEKTIDDADFDIIQNIVTINDMANLTKYFNEYKKQVKDFKTFRTACTRRKQAIGGK